MCTLASMHSSSYALNSCDIHGLGGRRKNPRKKKKPLSKPNNYLTQSLIDNLIILCYQIGHEGTMLGIDYCH
jgi:hypothetical protein